MADPEYDPGDEFAIFRGLIYSIATVALAAVAGLSLAATFGWL